MRAVKVEELQPGDVVKMNGVGAVFIAAQDHPLYTGLKIVVWVFIDNSHPMGLKATFDALSPQQVVGELVEDPDLQTRGGRLKSAMEILNG